MRQPSSHPSVWILAGTLLVGGCVSTEDKIRVIEKINADFQQCNERTLRRQGTRTYRASRERAFTAMRASLESASMGMKVTEEDRLIGLIRAVAPAPRPNSDEEWQRALDKDLPKMRARAAEEIGIIGKFLKFRPEDFEIVITVSMLSLNPAELEIKATMRMQEIAPPDVFGWPHRTYPPCEAVVIGVDKFWRSFEQALGET